ncbi:helix-turn-helix domain-containing protein [Bacillus atrophaeus]|uniref:helix-turn-helix transcriptional regulator n=1 Tax=Bacillus atrophaeus TaxID=1452 RepID=UPI00227EB7FA|nr:helix-turn-helix transcriptional regulator [Bacillus atrophaeus]MCY8913168.1 helix-turn-helix domain-containing protein [Bacillus atrophaeus]MCY9114684.1 helix-turn-helix domain-containing protein [Bacillus atrophaeus]MEC0924180.1 helix-turn-helix transcriptional regulator [Bacillus atrophaeus]MEC0932791.1 helix-turn-helix transcriptional regulator [Bacillus atrophaeus]
MSALKREDLISARKAKGFSRPKLASLAGVSFEHIKSLEYGRVNPSIALMYRLCNILEASPEDLFKDIVCS